MSGIDKSGVGSLFDRIASTYDGLNHFLSLGIDRSWRKKAVAGMSASGDFLDVAAGTADLTVELLRQGKAGTVIGIDLSENMMEIGRRKLAGIPDGRGGHYGDSVKLIRGSALEMPFPEKSFDAVTCAYGVRNFSEMDRGLAEMYRVLKDNGELMILEFSYPSNRAVRVLYDFYFSRILPFVGRIVSHDRTAYSYLNRSVKGFIWGEEFCSHLREAGFRDISFDSLTFGITTVYRAGK